MKTFARTILHVIMIGWLAPAAAASLLFDPEAWDLPRHSEALVADRKLSELVQELEMKPALTLRIRHPGGDAGHGEAEALRAALIALGVPGARIQLEPGATENNRLLLETTDRP